MKPSEFRLLLAFGILAFVIVTAFGYMFLNERRKQLVTDRAILNKRLATAKVYQKNEAKSLQREAWLTSRVPVYGSEDQMKTYLLKFVEQRASSYNLVPEPQPRQPELRDGYMRSVLEVKVTGTIDQLFPFLFSLQDPEEFRTITSFDLKSKPKEPTTLFADFTIEQWWNPDSPTLVANAEATPAEMPVGAPPGTGGVQPPIPAPAPGATSDGGGLPAPLRDAGSGTPVPAPAPTTQLPVLNESGTEEKPQ